MPLMFLITSHLICVFCYGLDQELIWDVKREYAGDAIFSYKNKYLKCEMKIELIFIIIKNQ